MKCPKCNNENTDDAVYCPVCYAALLKVGPAAPGPAPARAQPAHQPAPERPRPIRMQSPALPWRQALVVVAIASATLLIVSGALRLLGDHGAKEPVGTDSLAATAQGALEHAFSAGRAAGGGDVVLERLALLTAASVVEKNVPSQTLGTYAGWVLKKAQAALAGGGRDCRVLVRVSLHSEAAPSFAVAAVEGEPEAAVLQRLRQELKTLDPLHTSAQDVSFGAYFKLKGPRAAPAMAGGAAAEPRASRTASLDVEAVRQACGVEIGMFCNKEKSAPAPLVRCLRGHSRDLLEACSRSLSIPGE